MILIKALIWLFCIGILFRLIICVAWICLVLMFDFYNKNIKSTKKKRCGHTHATYHDGLYDFWQCDDCGENFPD